MKPLDVARIFPLMQMPHGEHIYVLEESYRAGNFDALLRALLNSRGGNGEVPFWVLKESFKVIVEHAFGNRGRSRGRTGNVVARYKQDLIHNLRAQDVDEILDHQISDREELDGLAGLKPSWAEEATRIKAYKKDYEASIRGIGKGKKDAFRAAERIRSGYSDACSQHTVEKSYNLVKREPRRFLTLNLPLIALFGLDGVITANKNVKFNELVAGRKLGHGAVQRHYQAPLLKENKGAEGNRPERLKASPQGSASPARQWPPSRLGEPAAMEALRTAIGSGNLLALLDYLAIKIANNDEVPDWLLEETILAIVSLVDPKSSDGKGRHGGAAARHRDELNHFIRYQVFQLVRGQQALVRRRVEKARQRNQQRALAALEAMRQQLGWSSRRAYEIACGKLQETSWACSVDQMKKSVGRLKRDEALCSRLWVPLTTSREMNIEGVWTEKMGKEYTELITQNLLG